MAENAVNHIIGAVQLVVGWLGIAVKVQQAILNGLNAALEGMKLTAGK